MNTSVKSIYEFLENTSFRQIIIECENSPSVFFNGVEILKINHNDISSLYATDEKKFVIKLEKYNSSEEDIFMYKTFYEALKKLIEIHDFYVVKEHFVKHGILASANIKEIEK